MKKHRKVMEMSMGEAAVINRVLADKLEFFQKAGWPVNRDDGDGSTDRSRLFFMCGPTNLGMRSYYVARHQKGYCGRINYMVRDWNEETAGLTGGDLVDLMTNFAVRIRSEWAAGRL